MKKLTLFDKITLSSAWRLKKGDVDMENFLNFGSNQIDEQRSFNLESDFRELTCKQQVDSNQFVQESYFFDTLILNYNKKVVGRGINCVANLLTIYFQKGAEKYVYQPGQVQRLGSESDKASFDLMLVGIEEEKSAFIITGDSGNKTSVYRLADDIVVASFFETDPYHNQNRFYGAFVRDIKNGLCTCDITADPRRGNRLLKFVACIMGE